MPVAVVHEYLLWRSVDNLHLEPVMYDTNSVHLVLFFNTSVNTCVVHNVASRLQFVLAFDDFLVGSLRF